MKKWDKIARTGTFTAMSGKQVTITKSKLDELVKSFVPETYKPPVVKGHPKVEDPAFGHVAELKREGDILFALYASVPDELKNEVYSGRYLSKSISVFPPKSGEPWKLKHVGLLGAAAPAIDGLGGIQLSEGEDGALMFANFQTEEQATMDEKDKKIADLEAKLKAEQDAKTAAESAREKETQARAEAEGKLAKTAEEQASASRTAKVEKLITEGKVLPAEKEQIAEFAKALEGGEEISFSAGEGKKPLADHFWSWVEGRKEHGLFEFSAADTNPQQGGETADLSGLAGKF
ncbi:hypothetical protein ACQ0P8_04090 [Halodesulfovibrio aestuarii]|uniref:Uncharacterized protein n=1 Tax=Halodesulfovibrio aestuarii TaxID=126333 RepID=A0A8G2C819_9BACT|nr:hypothetical protein [Halodesulfovibrio aestuarii]SHI74303.1 hypothetical protein SAMN05660830_00843 [Halodesulfovibrio aestuarii]